MIAYTLSKTNICKGMSIMTLRDLEVFLAVYEHNSMRKAAEALYISQPSVSGVIRSIEEEYEVRLFERLNHRLHITPEGKALAIRASRLLSQFQELEHSLKNSSEHDSLRIGATLTVGTCILPEILGPMKGLRAWVLVENTQAIENRLVKGELDIGFVEGEIYHPDLEVFPVMEDPLIAVCSQPAKEPLSLGELCRKYPLLMREPGSGTRAMLEDALTRGGVEWKEGWVCSNTQALLRAAQAGLGVTVISRLLAQDFLDDGKLFEIPLSDCRLERSFRLVWHKDKYQGTAFQNFCALCREYAQTKYSHKK